MKIIFTIFFIFTFSFNSFAVDEEQDDSSTTQRSKVSRGQKVDTKNLKDRYWAAGSAEDTRVIQNRAYVKKSKLELGIYYGTTNTDPFVSVNQLGGSLGYFFTEQIGVRALFWKHFSRRSSAHEQFDDQVRGAQILLTNHPKYFYGGEFVYSPIYGKLSLLGKMIIYYDFYLMLGAGMTRTERNIHLTPLGGIGQHVFLTQWMTLNMNYRLTYYRETIDTKVRTRLDDTVNLGLNFLVF